jgi:predicted alpha/beta superfamily hydrolase
MKTRFFIALLLLAFAFSQAQSVQRPLCIGEVHRIYSNVLKQERRLNIYLPINYIKGNKYPVVYLLDGSIHEDFMHIVGLVQFYNMQFTMPECIVVGIVNVDRKHDFTFHTDAEDLQAEFPSSGHSAAFIEFIETELQPFVQRNFAWNGQKMLIGQSLGGLLACEILLKRPQLFTDYLIVSPSLWWDNESLLNNAATLLNQHNDMQQPTSIYIAVGGDEHPTTKKEAFVLVLSKTENIRSIFL